MTKTISTEKQIAETLLVKAYYKIGLYGRPRKNPGQNRPLVKFNERSGKHQYSTLGAFMVAESTIKGLYPSAKPAAFSKAKRRAMLAFLAGYYLCPAADEGSVKLARIKDEITFIDEGNCDTREILRSFERALKTITKGE